MPDALGPGALYPETVAAWRTAIVDGGIEFADMTRSVQSCSVEAGGHGCGGGCCRAGMTLSAAAGAHLLAFTADRIDDLRRLGGPASVDDAIERFSEGRWRTVVRPVPDRTTARTDSACAYLNGEGLCTLHALAVEDGHHPFAYKPTGCWLFPFSTARRKVERPDGSVAERFVVGAVAPGDDPESVEQFPCVHPVDAGTPVYLTGLDELDALGEVFGVPGFSEKVAHDVDPSTRSVGRNDPCWCGSGLKRKRCDRHG